MSNPIKPFAAGLKAAARSLATKKTQFRIGNTPLVCPLCGHDEFDKHAMLMNTSGITLLNLDWAEKTACALVCKNCKRIELFAETPAYR